MKTLLIVSASFIFGGFVNSMINYDINHDVRFKKEIKQLQHEVARLNYTSNQYSYLAHSVKDRLGDSFKQNNLGGHTGEVSDLTLFDIQSSLDRIDRSIAPSIFALHQFLDDHHNKQESVNNMVGGFPVKNGWISSPFGNRIDPFTGKYGAHKGIDIAAPEGQKVLSTGTGTVVSSGYVKGYGNMVKISHANKIHTLYAHLKSISVTLGQSIQKGDIIGAVGSTGRSTGPHLHYEVIVAGKIGRAHV